tara:strand:- start:1583 stop:1798 length:216 start_codon:yes stop_codon:yes gene_type:complete
MSVSNGVKYSLICLTVPAITISAYLQFLNNKKIFNGKNTLLKAPLNPIVEIVVLVSGICGFYYGYNKNNKK